VTGAGGLGRLVLVAVAAACSSCERGRSAETGNEDRQLGGDVAAKVGVQAIPLSVIADVAAARKLGAREAALKVIDDEIAANAALSRGLDRAMPAAWQLVAARGRFTSEHILEEAKGRGPPNDEEVAFLSEKHWAEVDRPPAARVIHALVFHPKDKALEPRARALAEQLREALVDAPNEQFVAKAKAFPHDPELKTHAEPLPAITSEGKVVDGGGQMDPAFAKGAFTVESAGGTSQVVDSSFGYHVIRLVERLPEKRMPLELRRIAFSQEVYSLRARELLTVRLKELRGATPVTVSPAAETLMRSVALPSHEPSGAP
jgi:parvulin-like peptidyl-prolyl isomerase